MRRVLRVSLCVATLTLGTAAAATPAWAELPEFRTCVAVAGGMWGESKCATPLMNGGWELRPVGMTEKISFTSKSKGASAFDLKTKVATVECVSEGTGEILGPKGLELVMIKLGNCASSSFGGGFKECRTTGQLSGEIVVKPLWGRIGYAEKVTKVVGAELERTGLISEFVCNGVTVQVEGCMIAQALPVNGGIRTEGELEFKENETKNGQLWTKIEGGTHNPCKMTVHYLFVEETGWITAEEELTSAQGVELAA